MPLLDAAKRIACALIVESQPVTWPRVLAPFAALLACGAGTAG